MRVLYLGLVLILIFFPTGCWNAREIDELAFVMGIALDDAGNGKFKVTVQMAKPSTHSKSPTGGGGGEKEKPYWLATSTGQTLFEAIRNMATFTSRRIFWSHNKVIIISEKLARRDISEILDFFSRNPELRLRTWIAVTPGNAGDLLEKGPSMEKVTAGALEKVIEQRVWTGKGYGIMLKDMLEDYLSPATFPAAAKVVITEEASQPRIKLAGAAVFGEKKMAGWLDERQTRGLLWLKHRMHSTIMVVPCPVDGQPLSIEIVGAKVHYQSEFKGRKPQLKIMVNASGNLTEQACKTDYYHADNLPKLEKALAEAITTDIESTVRAAQKDLDLDFPGFNHIFHRQHNKQWRRVVNEWPSLFKEMQVSIHVDAKIPRVALFAMPLKAAKPQGTK